MVVYLDASALVKLIIAESETETLRGYLSNRPTRITGDLTVAEVLRASLRHSLETLQRAHAVLAGVDRVRLAPRIVDRAGRLLPPELRTRDALHVATALEFAGELEAFVAYDRRLLEAAATHGLPVARPA